MMGYMTFRTRAEAKAEVAKMRGWTTRIVQLYMPDDANADDNGNVYVIQCNAGNKYQQPIYLRTDGYVN